MDFWSYSLPSRIHKFLKKHHLLTLAISSANVPWCANCFYVYEPSDMSLIILSEKDTYHILSASQSNPIAGTIANTTKIPLKIQGIQFTGHLTELRQDHYQKARRKYLNRFPHVFFSKVPLWKIYLHYIKMTDNKLGFGTKTVWERPKQH